MGTPDNPYVIGDHPWVDLIVLVVFVIGFVWFMTDRASKG